MGDVIGAGPEVMIALIKLALLGAGTKAALTTVEAVIAAQAVARVLAVNAAPVKIVPVRIMARLQVVVEAASGTRIILPRVVLGTAASIGFPLLVGVLIGVVPVLWIVLPGVSVSAGICR